MSNGYPSYPISGVGEYEGYVIMSALTGGIPSELSVQGGTAAPGTPLVLTYGTGLPVFKSYAGPPTQQQLNDNAYLLWALTPGPAPYESSYYIVSMLPTSFGGVYRILRPPFVIDIQGGNAAAGTPLVINPMAGWFPWWWNVSVSQLWNMVSAGPAPGLGVWTLQSVQNPTLVISVYGASTAPGTPLVLWPIQENAAGTPTYPNQIWSPFRVCYDCSD
jgi:hypothetical protein